MNQSSIDALLRRVLPQVSIDHPLAELASSDAGLLAVELLGMHASGRVSIGRDDVRLLRDLVERPEIAGS